MEPVIFVEILDRRGRVQRRERIDSYPATIGRAYTNDVILDDPFVSPEHLIVTTTEAGLVVEDRDSRNGVFVAGSQRRVRRLALEVGTEVRIGHSRVRFCLADQPVAPAAQYAGSGLTDFLAHTWVRFLAIAGSVLAFWFSGYFDSFRKLEVADLMSGTAGNVCILLVWAALWALGNRLVAHEFRFLSHWTLASLAAVSLVILGVAQEYLDFFFSAGLSLKVLQWVLYPLFAVLVVYAHLSVAATMVARRRVIAGVLSVGVLYGLTAIVAFAESDNFSFLPEFSSELKPVGAGWLPAGSLDDFFAGTTGLEKRLDELVREEEDKERKAGEAGAKAAPEAKPEIEKDAERAPSAVRRGPPGAFGSCA